MPRPPVKISVIMPAYNGEAYIGPAIESVLCQNYDSYELLIGNDASTDNTAEIIRRYKKDKHVRIFNFKKNRGSAANGNSLIRMARGKYITPLDCDDLLLPGHLKRLSRYLDLHTKTGVVYADLLVMQFGKNEKLLRPPYRKGKDFNQTWDLCENVINHGGSMIRRNLFLKAGGYEKVVCAIDRGLWLRLAEITKFKYLRGETYYLYRRHPKSVTIKMTEKERVQERLGIFKKAVQRRYGIKI